MDISELKEEIENLFIIEPDEDGFIPREYPPQRLKQFHKLDFAYMDDFNWEGSTIHRYTRVIPAEEERIHLLTANADMPYRLFEAALRLFGDSIIAYHDKQERRGDIRFYPSVILTFWSGFETFVRYSSELMLLTVKDIPEAIANYLREREIFIDKKGKIETRTKYQAVLDRYAILLLYGYSFSVDKGNKYWQELEKAKELRDYYTHLDINIPRAVTSHEILSFMEAVMMGIIWPSSALQRTLLLEIYRLYCNWVRLRELATEYTEQPFFKDWPLQGPYQYHCNFENVDPSRFPNYG